MVRHVVAATTLVLMTNFGFQPLGLALSAMAADPSSFDGDYKPTSSSAMPITPRAHCNVRMSTMHIRNGVVHMKWRERITGPVNADGSLNVGGPGSKLDGQINNGVFEGKVSGPNCIFMVTLTKS